MRNLPETKEEWEKIKSAFLEYPGIEDTPETWTFILSQLQNTKMPNLNFDPNDVWCHYKRWKIAQVLQDEKSVYLTELQAKLEEKMKALMPQGDGNEGVSPSEHTEHLQDGSFNSEGDMPPLSGTEEGMVSNTP